MATSYASPRTATGYLASLKPIVDAAMAARTHWVRVLNDLAGAEDLREYQAEAVQVAVRLREQINELRRTLGGMQPPDVYRDMERALDGWLEALAASCDPIARLTGDLQRVHVDQARRKLRDAAAQAARFNAERGAVITVGAPPPERESFAPDTAVVKRNWRLYAGVSGALVLVIGALYFAFVMLGNSAAPAAPRIVTPADGLLGPGPGRRVYTQPQIVARLRQEIATRRLAFQSPDVQLVEPDKVIVRGIVPLPLSQVEVEVELAIGATENGRPRLTPGRVAAGTLQVPPEVLEALNRRTEEANAEIARQVLPDQFIRRAFVERDTVVVDVEVNPAAPANAADPANQAKPGAPAKPAV